MTKEEFKEFSSDAQHNMVLEALERVTKNIEIIENESGRPFADTNVQRMNDIKLLTILADAFSKNELAWNKKTKSEPWEQLPESMRRGNTKTAYGLVDGCKRMSLEEYVKEKIKES